MKIHTHRLGILFSIKDTDMKQEEVERHKNKVVAMAGVQMQEAEGEE